jgi:uncharacterized small protein (DUF1192 family)
MALMDDNEPLRRAVRHELGQDLSALSLTEIDARIAQLHEEIERLRAERVKKESSRGAADALFRLP